MRDVFFLTSGQLRVPSLAVDPPRLVPSPLIRRLSNTVGVVVRDDGDVVLVDCGWSEDACADPRSVLGRAWSRLLGVHLRAGDSIVRQLADVGIGRERVKTIVATHLHLDHIGGAIDFPDAEIVCADVELTAFRSLKVRGGYRAKDLARGARLRPVAIEGAPSYGFPASRDLFGDGEVVLLDARGHTPGLVAVAIRARAEEGARDGALCYVHIGDAVYQSWEYALAPKGPSVVARLTTWRRPLLERTYASIRACEADPRRPVIVPSHDFAVFATLPHAPQARAAAE